MEPQKLTENLVLQKTRVDNLQQVKSLNLWGNDLCDISVLKEMTNVEVVSLSVNKIRGLKDFACCPKLQELYLRKNEIRDLQEVDYLKGLQNLKILWLCDNPCADSPSYRTYVIRTIPHLEKLDNIDVAPQERAAAVRLTARDCEAIRQEAGAKNGTRVAVQQQEVVEKVRSKWLSESEAPSEQITPQFDTPAVPPQYPRAPSPQMDCGPPAPPAHNIRANPKPKSKTSRVIVPSQKNILTAVLSLLNELNTESLEIVHQEVTERLTER
jgi:Leucine-rich repeat (LRR) protein